MKERIEIESDENEGKFPVIHEAGSGGAVPAYPVPSQKEELRIEVIKISFRECLGCNDPWMMQH